MTDDADINLEAIEVLVHRLRKKLTDTGVQITTRSESHAAPARSGAMVSMAPRERAVLNVC